MSCWVDRTGSRSCPMLCFGYKRCYARRAVYCLNSVVPNLNKTGGGACFSVFSCIFFTKLLLYGADITRYLYPPPSFCFAHYIIITKTLLFRSQITLTRVQMPSRPSPMVDYYPSTSWLSPASLHANAIRPVFVTRKLRKARVHLLMTTMMIIVISAAWKGYLINETRGRYC
jgi:hypothetical protein